MKYILRTLWVVGLIPGLFLAAFSILIYTLIVFPIAAAFIFIKTGKLEEDDIQLPGTFAEWFLDKYNGLLGKIK